MARETGPQAKRALVAKVGPEYLDYIDEHVRQPGETDARLIDRLIRTVYPQHEAEDLIPEVARHGERLRVYQPNKEIQRRIDNALGNPSSLARIDAVWILHECPGARVADVIATLRDWQYSDNGRTIVESLVHQGVAERLADAKKPRVKLTDEFLRKLDAQE